MGTRTSRGGRKSGATRVAAGGGGAGERKTQIMDGVVVTASTEGYAPGVTINPKGGYTSVPDVLPEEGVVRVHVFGIKRGPYAGGSFTGLNEGAVDGLFGRLGLTFESKTKTDLEGRYGQKFLSDPGLTHNLKIGTEKWSSKKGERLDEALYQAARIAEKSGAKKITYLSSK